MVFRDALIYGYNNKSLIVSLIIYPFSCDNTSLEGHTSKGLWTAKTMLNEFSKKNAQHWVSRVMYLEVLGIKYN